MMDVKDFSLHHLRESIVKIFVEAVDVGDVGKWRQKLI